MKPVVVHVITGLNTGGAELMLARLVERNQFSRFNHRVICLTDEGPVADQIRSYGVPVQNLGMARGLPNPNAIRRLGNMISNDNAAIVQTWLYHADLVGGLAARMAHVPVAWGIHHSKLDPASTSRRLKLTVKTCARLSSRIPDAIVCCAAASRVSHIDHGFQADRMVVIPNGFDTSVFRPDPVSRSAVRAELGIGDLQPLIGIAGRFIPLKNHKLFVDSAGLLAIRNPDARFVMVGDGLQGGNAELEQWIAEAGIADKVSLLGRRNDMNQVLAALDVCALTSRTEAFPMTIGEAMATGVPCIATDVGDTAYLIGDTGRVVPSGDIEAFANAIGEVVEMDPVLRQAMGSRARQRMIDHFDIQTIASRYDDLWTSIIAGEFPCA